MSKTNQQTKCIVLCIESCKLSMQKNILLYKNKQNLMNKQEEKS